MAYASIWSRLLCALVLSLLAVPFAVTAQAQRGHDAPMTFTLEQDGAGTPRDPVGRGDRAVYASGTITGGTTLRLLAFVRDHHLEHVRLFFDSGGGRVDESFRLGRAIRQLRFNTAIGRAGDEPDRDSAAICASACVFAYAGGENRFMKPSSGRLGIHQFYAAKRMAAIAETQAISGMIVAYLAEMGVDPQAFALQSMVDSDSILWLTPEQARELGFVNDGAKPTTAEIRLIAMTPALVLYQQRYNMDMSAALTCDNGTVQINAWLQSANTNAAHARGLSRVYFELDGQLALNQPGPRAATFDGTGVSVSRTLSTETLARLLAANTMAVWFENGGSTRWGGVMDLHPVHEKMADYFAHCLDTAARTDAPSAPPAKQKSGQRTDLIITYRKNDQGANELRFVDRATARRGGASSTMTGYWVGRKKGDWVFIVAAFTFDCDAHLSRDVIQIIDHRGRKIGADSDPWEVNRAGSVGRVEEDIACGRAEVSDQDLIDASDPPQAIAAFIDAVERQEAVDRASKRH